MHLNASLSFAEFQVICLKLVARLRKHQYIVRTCVHMDRERQERKMQTLISKYIQTLLTHTKKM